MGLHSINSPPIIIGQCSNLLLLLPTAITISLSLPVTVRTSLVVLHIVSQIHTFLLPKTHQLSLSLLMEYKKQVIEQPSRRPERTTLDRSSTEEVKLAAIAISLNVRLKSADMPTTMQEHAFRYTTSLLLDASHSSKRPSPTHLARALKKEFDTEYGPAWHCVVGTSFGSYVTHSPGGFVYFSIDSLSFLLFKTELHLVTESTPMK